MASKQVTIKQKLRPLDEKEQLFVEAYCGPANFNNTKAYELAGYGGTTSKKQNAYELINRPHVQKAIRERLEQRKNTYWLDENLILERLWEEANRVGNGSSHAARIQALVYLGKHIGMWQERVNQHADQSVTYNIINYSEDPKKEKIVKAIEQHKKEVEEVKDTAIDLGVEIKNYND
jgi:phage terminase small subunit